MIDLVKDSRPVLVVATMILKFTRRGQFHGSMATVDAMRNALFHGEAHPTPDILKCYKPEYRIVMLFLACVR